MNTIISAHLNQYKSQYKQYNSLMKKAAMGIITYDEVKKEIDPGNVERLRYLCVEDYAEELGRNSDKEKLYNNWLTSVTDADDFYLLEVMLWLQSKVVDIDFNNSNLFLLNYFVKYFERSEDEDGLSYAKYLLEWIPDVLDNNTEECSEALDRIFSLGKSSHWFENFYDQIMKLTLRSPVNEKTFQAVKKGLSIETTIEIKEFLEEYLEEHVS